MALPIRQGATHKVVIGPVVAVANGYVPVTSLTLSGADEAEVILHDNGTVVDISGYTFAAITTADGYYHLTLQSGISNTVGHMTVCINDDSLCLPVRQDFVVIETAIYDGLYADGSTYIPTNVVALSGDTTAADNAEAFFDGTGYAGTGNVIPTVTTVTNNILPQQPPVRVPNGVTDQSIYFVAYSSTNHSSRVTGLSSFTVYRSRNGGTATLYTTPTITETDSTNMPGVYEFVLDEDMTLDAGDYSQEMVLHITASGMDPVTRTIEIYRRDVDAPVKGTALSDIPFYMVDSTDHVTPETGLTITAEVSKDGAAFAGAAGSVTEIGSGAYQFDATAADMTADVVLLKFTASGADPVLITIKTVPA